MAPRLNYLQSYLVQEFVDEYHEGRMSRRDMLKRVLGITGSAAAAATVLLSMGCAPQATPSPTPTTAATPKPAAAPASPTTVATPTAAGSPTAAATARPAEGTPSGAGSPTPGGTPAAKATPPPPATPSGPRSKLSVKPDDPDVTAADVTFPGPESGVMLMGYLAQLKGAGPYPAVLVCHENRGLVEHIRDVTRRFAKAGYVALAVDLLSRDGGTAKVDPGLVPGKLTANPARNVADFQAAFKHLQTLAFVQKANVGMNGYCFGGGTTWSVAAAIPELKAAVPFYGPAVPVEDVPKIRAAILAIYGETDQRINAGIPTIEDAMKRNGKVFEKVVYPGAGHAFHNDTGANWNEQAAYDAWQKTLDWFKKYLA